MNTVTLSKEFISQIVNASRYASLMNAVNKDTKKIVFSFKKDDDSYLYYTSSSVFGKVQLGVADVNDDFNYELDFDKFLHIINSTTDSITMTFSESQCKITSDKLEVDILCWKIEDNDTILSIFSEKDFNSYTDQIELSQDLSIGLSLVNKLIGNSKNNAVALFKNKIMYADRVQIYQKSVDLNQSNLDDKAGLVLHKNVFTSLTDLLKINKNDTSTVSFKKKSGDTNSFLISDSISKIVVSNSQAAIGLPEDDDLKRIEGEVLSFELDQSVIIELLDFFSGFFVGTSWKPLTFVNKDGKLHIQYCVPSVTNVYREVTDLAPDSKWDKFVIDADSLANYVKNQSGLYSFLIEEDKQGVTIQSPYDKIIFSKLV